VRAGVQAVEQAGRAGHADDQQQQSQAQRGSPGPQSGDPAEGMKCRQEQ